ncbi:Uncharacterised protein [Vibrio cholerae]|nr:Uncharacterised protein [Vibrio cholerae]CSI46734.1 Uncharacterised protein [Vibrio cholerae]
MAKILTVIDSLFTSFTTGESVVGRATSNDSKRTDAVSSKNTITIKMISSSGVRSGVRPKSLCLAEDLIIGFPLWPLAVSRLSVKRRRAVSCLLAKGSRSSGYVPV